MKKAILILIILCMAIILSNCTADSDMQGNRTYEFSGNKIFYALDYDSINVVNEDGTGYYQLEGLGSEFIIYKDNIYTNTNGPLTKCSLDGKQITDLADSADFIFDIKNDHIYYLVNDPMTNATGRLYCINTDGTNAHQLDERNVNDCWVCGDTVYYTVFNNNAPDGDPLNEDYYEYLGVFRTNTDGSKRELVVEGNIPFIIVEEPYLIFFVQLSWDQYEAHCLNLTDGRSETIPGMEWGSIESVEGIKDGYIYFIKYTDHFALFRYKPFSGKEPEPVFDSGDVLGVDMDNEWVVYAANGQSRLAHFDGSDTRTLCDDTITDLCFHSGKIYYYTEGEYFVVTQYQYDIASGERRELPTDYSQPPAPQRHITAGQIDSFSFGEGEYGVFQEYSVSRSALSAQVVIPNYNKPESVVTEAWSTEKWDAFISDLLACGVGDWREEYKNDRILGEYYWHLTLTGDFGTLNIYGDVTQPEEWDAFISVINEYFNTTPQPTQKPYPPPETVEFLTQAPLPAPNLEGWYDWERAGAYTTNPYYGYLYYCEEEDLLIRIEEQKSSADLVASRLDGTGRQVLDTVDTLADGIESVNYYDGWVYYLKSGGIWRVRPDGTQLKLFTDCADGISDLLVYNGTVYYIPGSGSVICAIGINGGENKTYNVAENASEFYYIDGDSICYGAWYTSAAYGDESGLFKYNFNSGETVMLAADVNVDTVLTHGDALFYSGYMFNRVDPYGTTVIGDNPETYYYLYGNYFFYLSGYYFPSICAIDIETQERFSLFELPEMYYTDFYITENSIFLYSGSMEDPVFRITFEDDTAKLWKLNGLVG